MKKVKQVPAYPGPSREDVQRMTDDQVDSELIRLKKEPRVLHTGNDDEWFIATYGEKDFDHMWTKEELQELRQNVHAWHRRCLKGQLFSAYIAAWIATLSDAACWMLIEQFELKKVGLSERRYTSRHDLNKRTGWAVYASEVNKQKPANHQPKGDPMHVPE